MPDLGLTHVALPVSNIDRSVGFYSKFAEMVVVQRRQQDDQPEKEVAWLSDLTRTFVLVLVEMAVEYPLGPFAHLGVACESQDAVDRFAETAKQNGCFRDGPYGAVGEPAGYFVILDDPDGHTLELSFGQDVSTAVAEARDNAP